ncbi:hypothetical protein GQ53DRAFT_69777 [Thozetella sp. PMI_491]|nr:hypothetical protein GQ53DRAFT_69777 [Thozetella sp. PMI_491]
MPRVITQPASPCCTQAPRPAGQGRNGGRRSLQRPCDSVAPHRSSIPLAFMIPFIPSRVAGETATHSCHSRPLIPFLRERLRSPDPARARRELGPPPWMEKQTVKRKKAKLSPRSMRRGRGIEAARQRPAKSVSTTVLMNQGKNWNEFEPCAPPSLPARRRWNPCQRPLGRPGRRTCQWVTKSALGPRVTLY